MSDGGSLSAAWRRGRAQVPYIPRALALVWAAAPGWTVLWGALLVVQGLLPAATVYLTRAVVDSLVAVIASGMSRATLVPAWLSALLMAIVMLLSQLLGALSGWVRVTQSELVGDYVRSMVHRQSVALDLAFYDQPDFYDHLHRARDEASYRPLSLLESIGRPDPEHHHAGSDGRHPAAVRSLAAPGVGPQHPVRPARSVPLPGA